MRISPIRVDRIRRHALGIGPAPAYRMSHVIAKDRWHVEAQRLMNAWGKAVPKGPGAHVWMDEVDDDYARLTIAFDPPIRWASQGNP